MARKVSLAGWVGGIATVVAVVCLASALDLSERLHALSREYEAYQLDEIIFFLPQLLLAGVAYALGDRTRRRLDAQSTRETVLRQVNAELESRVAERTAALAAANESLRQEAEERRRAEVAAEAANQAKSAALAKMSHEIRTPLSGVLGMLDLALEGPLPDKARKWLEMARYSGRSLLGIVNNVLDVSKIESGTMRLELVDFETHPEFERILRSLAPEARRRGLAFAWTIEPDLPDWLRGDLGRFRQTLVNLVGNACKYTEQGGVTVTIRPPAVEWLASLPRPLGRESAPVFVSVRDTGVGVPADKLETIFESFAQVAGSSGQKPGGVGLGLAISRELVRLMGGGLGVRSEPGRGSEFEFWVMFERGRPAAAQAAPSVAQAGLPPLRALVVEDSDVNRELAMAMLARRGVEAVGVANGRQALERLAGDRFDVVFMDVSMPELDGMRTTRLIRDGEAGEAARSIPVVALTAHALTGDRERFLAAGMDEYLTKPLDPARLEESLARVAAGRGDRSG